MPIPDILHFIWLQPTIPLHFVSKLMDWLEYCPYHTIYLWTNQSLLDPIKDHFAFTTALKERYTSIDLVDSDTALFIKCKKYDDTLFLGTRIIQVLFIDSHPHIFSHIFIKEELNVWKDLNSAS